MNWLQFSVEMTKALAWPLAVVVGVVVIRGNLKRWFVERPNKMKLGPAEFEWDAAVAEVRNDLELPSPDDGDASVNNSHNLNIHPPVPSDPLGEALSTCSKIEATLLARLRFAGKDPKRSIGMRGLAQEALENNIINGTIANSIMKLSRLKSMAVHEFNAMTEGQSYEFAIAAVQVYGRLTGFEVPGHDPLDSASICCGSSALILDTDNRILILKVTWAEKWVLPGGNIGFGETPVDSCIRQVAEQLEIAVSVSDPTFVCWSQEDSRTSTIDFIFNVGQLTSIQESSMSPNFEEIEEWMYCSLEEIGGFVEGKTKSLITSATLASSMGYSEVRDPSIKPIRGEA